MTPLDHNLTRAQLASKPTAQAVEAVTNELKRMIRVEEGKAK